MWQAIIKTSLLDENFQHASDSRIKLLLDGVAIFPNQIQLGKESCLRQSNILGINYIKVLNQEP